MLLFNDHIVIQNKNCENIFIGASNGRLIMNAFSFNEYTKDIYNILQMHFPFYYCLRSPFIISFIHKERHKIERRNNRI